MLLPSALTGTGKRENIVYNDFEIVEQMERSEMEAAEYEEFRGSTATVPSLEMLTRWTGSDVLIVPWRPAIRSIYWDKDFFGLVSDNPDSAKGYLTRIYCPFPEITS